jgi:DNA-directed RNA polymerase subunit K/omega
MNKSIEEIAGDLLKKTKNDTDINSENDINSEDDINSESEGAESEGAESDVESDVESIKDEDQLTEGDSKPYSKQNGGAFEGDGDEDENDDDDDDENDDEDDNYLQKFNQQMRDDLILNFHPESKSHNYEEIKQLAKVTRNKNGIIVDELHKTIPLLTKYEKTRILGQRSKQIECGAVSLVQVPPNIIDSYLIANLELEQGKIPFIIRRPLPNGGMEYWYVSDLEDL